MSRHLLPALILDDRWPVWIYFLLPAVYLRGCGPMVHDGLAARRQSRRAKFKAPGQSLIV